MSLCCQLRDICNPILLKIVKRGGPPGQGKLVAEAARVKRWDPPASGRLVAEAGAAPRVKRAQGPPGTGGLVAEADVDDVRAGAAPRVKRAGPPAKGRALLAEPVGPPGRAGAALRVKQVPPSELDLLQVLQGNRVITVTVSILRVSDIWFVNCDCLN